MKRLIAAFLFLAAPAWAKPLPALRLVVPLLGDVVRGTSPQSGGGGGGGVSFTDSAGLRAALSDETGTGLAVFATSPLFTTSIDINSTGTTITESAAGKIAVEGVDVLTQTNTITGITNKTFVAPVLGAATATSVDVGSTSTTLSESAAGWLAVEGNNLIKGNTQQITIAGPTAARTYTVPDANGTLVDLASTQTINGTKTFNNELDISNQLVLTNTGYLVIGAGGTNGPQLRLWTALTPDAPAFSTNATSNSFHLAENADLYTAAFDFQNCSAGTSAATNPLFCIHSNSQSTTKWIDFQHNDTNGQIKVGSGGLILPGMVGSSGTVPVVSNTTANSCGTTAATITGTDTTGAVVVGATAGTSCTLAFNAAAPTRRQCWCSNETTLANVCNTHYTDTTHTNLAGTFVAGDTVNYGCLTY